MSTFNLYGSAPEFANYNQHPVKFNIRMGPGPDRKNQNTEKPKKVVEKKSVNKKEPISSAKLFQKAAGYTLAAANAMEREKM